MALNPYEQEIAQLRAQLAAAEMELVQLQEQLSGLPSWHAAADVARAAIAQKARVIVDLKNTIARKEVAAKELDQAAAEAVSQGLTPEAGIAKALAEKSRSQALKYVAIGVAILLVAAALYYFIWRKK